MDLLFVSYSPLLGGAERILLDTLRGAGRDAAVACPDGPLAEAARSAGLRVLPMVERSLQVRATPRDRVLAPARLAAQAVEVRRHLAAERPRAVVGWGMRSSLVAAAALGGRRGSPAFVFQHNDVLPGPAIARGIRTAAARADRVIALSHTIAADLDPAGRLGSRLAVVHPGVDLDRFRTSPPPADPCALVLGAIVPWKRPELALEAAALAAQRLPDLRLTLAGAPLDAAGERLLEGLRRRAAASDLAGRVRFPGPVEDTPAALSSASCLLHCADREPLGLVVLEALACGRPVVAPGDGGPAEVLDESCGRLYPPGDPRAAADALVEAVSAAGRLGEAAHRRAESGFALETARRRWWAAADEVLP